MAQAARSGVPLSVLLRDTRVAAGASRNWPNADPQLGRGPAQSEVAVDVLAVSHAQCKDDELGVIDRLCRNVDVVANLQQHFGLRGDVRFGAGGVRILADDERLAPVGAGPRRVRPLSIGAGSSRD